MQLLEPVIIPIVRNYASASLSKMVRNIQATFSAAVMALFSFSAHANDWDALKEPGAVAFMRHALAPGTGDPAKFEIGDCTTQRNLDERGREQARRIGATLRERGITFDYVWTSQWCRTRETADLLNVGPVTAKPALNSFFEDRSTRDAQTDALLEALESVEGRTMLVTHQVNISAFTGSTTRSGEVVVVRLTDGGVEVIGRIAIDP